MITIQEHISNKFRVPDVKLDLFANQLWEELNRKNKDGSYSAYSIIKQCLKWEGICQSKSSKYIEKMEIETDAINRHKDFWSYIIRDDFENLKKIIISRPYELVALRNEIMDILDESDLFVAIKGQFKKTEFSKNLIKIFNYKNFRKSEFCFNLFEELQINNSTCPYCNLEKLDITTSHKSELTNEQQKKMYLDIDHFMPQVLSPFFSVSFYNLIPSCHKCNARDKSSKNFLPSTHIHPYLTSFDDYFKFNVTIEELTNTEITEVLIQVNEEINYNSIEDLNLINRYNARLSDVDGTYSYIKRILVDIYRHNNPEEKENLKEYLFHIIPKYKREILTKVTGKLGRDLLSKIDIDRIIELE